MAKLVFEGVAVREPGRNDGGQYLGLEGWDQVDPEPTGTAAIAVSLSSWDELKDHTALTALLGKRLRITIEEVSDG